MNRPMKLRSVDNGYCRVNYLFKNEQDKQVPYCIQDEGSYVVVYRQSADLEPMYEVKAPLSLFEIPTGDSVIEHRVRTVLEAQND